MLDPGYAHFASAVEARRISGSAWHSGAAFFLLSIALFDLSALTLGGGGLSTLLLTGLSRILPEGLKGPAVPILIVALVDGVLLAFGLQLLAVSPWRRWISSSLRANLPFRLLFDLASRRRVAGVSSRGAWLALGLQVLAFIFVVVAFRSAHGLMLHWRSMPTLVAVALLLLFAYLSVWILGTLYDNAVARVGAVAQGDRATVMGVAMGIAACIPMAIAADAATDVLYGYAMSPSGEQWFRLMAFYVAACVLIAITVLCLGSVGERDVETLDLAPGSPDVSVDLPDCTGGEYAPFRFRVRSHGNQVILVSSPVNDPDHTTLLTTLDSHDLTIGRYSIINLSALAQQHGRSVTLRYEGVMSGRFDCQLDVAIVTTPIESFISDLRRDGGSFPMEALSVLRAAVLAPGTQGGTLRALFQGAVQDVEMHLTQQLPGPFSEIRSLEDTARRLASEAGDQMNHQIALFQDQNRSVLDGRDSALTINAIGRIASLRTAYGNQHNTLINSLRGEDRLRNEIERQAAETAGEGLDALLTLEVQDPVMRQQAARLMRLFTLCVIGVRVTRTEASREVEAALLAVTNDLQQRHDSAIQNMLEVSLVAGKAEGEVIGELLRSTTIPYEIRLELGGLLTDALARRKTPAPFSAPTPLTRDAADGRLASPQPERSSRVDWPERQGAAQPRPSRVDRADDRDPF